MDNIYFLMLIALAILAVADLVVGVSNDAVNFLNSAIGSKAISFKTIMIVASFGIAAGALFSSGMMEVARKGIFNPGEFYFDEIMFIFMAVMITDILLLDFFNTLGMPTSTTVSIVFELLGAAVAMSLIKIGADNGSFTEVVNYINNDKAIQIIFGILLSVVVAFSIGALVQWVSRLLLSYNFEKKPTWVGALFGGFALDGPSLNSGTNPAYGADIYYYLQDSTNQKVEIQVLTDNDEIIRTLKGKQNAGIHRVMWDLRYEPTYKAKLKTTPPGRPWVQLNGEGWRPLVTWDLDLWRGQFGPRVVPKNYKIKLIVGEEEFIRELEVVKDPNSEASLEELTEQVAFSLELRDAMNLAVTMINDIETIRAELNEIIPKLDRSGDRKKSQELRTVAETIIASLYDIQLTGAREDAFRSPIKLYGRLSALASDIGAFGSDFKPTDQQREVYAIFNKRLKDVDAKFKKFIDVDIKKLNIQLKKSELQIKNNKKIKS